MNMSTQLFIADIVSREFNGTVSAEAFFTSDSNIGDFAYNPLDRKVLYHPKVLDLLYPEEIRSCVLHELGHAYFCFTSKVYRLNRRALELGCDIYAAKKTLDPMSLITGLIKSCIPGNDLAANLRPDDPEYPSLIERATNVGVVYEEAYQKAIEEFRVW